MPNRKQEPQDIFDEKMREWCIHDTFPFYNITYGTEPDYNIRACTRLFLRFHHKDTDKIIQYHKLVDRFEEDYLPEIIEGMIIETRNEIFNKDITSHWA